MKNPLVNVFMVTYNHELYVAQAIEGVLAQKCNFDYELVIGEDCSTDNTSEIIKSYENDHRKIIKARYNTKNLGMLENGIKTLKECTSKYIAFCEGDDYWIDPHKLQKQVDWLQQNENYSACVHLAKTVYEYEPNSGEQGFIFNPKSDTLLHNDFLRPFRLATCSLMYRRILIDITELTKYSNLVRDRPFMIILSTFGPFKVLPDVMAVYRRNKGGVSENISLGNMYKAEIDTANELKMFLPNFNFKALSVKDLKDLDVETVLNEIKSRLN